MPDWNYSFDTISKASWLKQIEAELRPRGIDSIQSEWWPGEMIVTTLHAEDKIPLIRLPDQLFVQQPSIMEWIDMNVDDAKTTNQKILDALSNGAQSLVLQVDPEKKMPFRLWLDGVYTDMIELYISLSKESPEIINSVKEIIPSTSLIRLNRKYSNQSSSVFLEALQGSTDENAKSYRFIYEFTADGNWTSKTTEIFQRIIDDLTYWTSQGFSRLDYLENCILVLKPDTDYVKQIIQTRTLHLLWNNLWHFYMKNEVFSTTSYLECHVLPDHLNDPDQYLVRASTSALSASLTGVHCLCIHAIDDSRVARFYHRSDRNIHHLLNLESEMYKGTDPLAGSYIVDYYTRRWTMEVWSCLSF